MVGHGHGQDEDNDTHVGDVLRFFDVKMDSIWKDMVARFMIWEPEMCQLWNCFLSFLNHIRKEKKFRPIWRLSKSNIFFDNL